MLSLLSAEDAHALRSSLELCREALRHPEGTGGRHRLTVSPVQKSSGNLYIRVPL